MQWTQSRNCSPWALCQLWTKTILSQLVWVPIHCAIQAQTSQLYQEIKFGDNDTLSIITSSMIHSDYLFLFTNVNGLYTANLRKDSSVQLIEVVELASVVRTQGTVTNCLVYLLLLVHVIDGHSEHVNPRLEPRNRWDGNKTHRSGDCNRRWHVNYHNLQPSPHIFICHSRVPQRDASFRLKWDKTTAHFVHTIHCTVMRPQGMDPAYIDTCRCHHHRPRHTQRTFPQRVGWSSSSCWHSQHPQGFCIGVRWSTYSI